MAVRVIRVRISPIIHIKMLGCVLDSTGSGHYQSMGQCLLRNAHSVAIKGGVLLDFIAQMKLDAHCKVQTINLIMYFRSVSYNLCSIGPDTLVSTLFSIIARHQVSFQYLIKQ